MNFRKPSWTVAIWDEKWHLSRNFWPRVPRGHTSDSVNDSYSPILENLFILQIFHHFCIKALIIGPLLHFDLNLEKNLVIFGQYSQFYCKPLVALQIAVCFSFTDFADFLRSNVSPFSVTVSLITKDDEIIVQKYVQ